MENLLPIILFSTPFAVLTVTFIYFKRLKRLFLSRLITNRMGDGYIYSSLVTEKICDYVLRAKKSKRQNFIKSLIKNDIKVFNKQIEDANIRVYTDICRGKKIRTNIKDELYLLILAKYYLKENRYDDSLKVLQKINLKKLNSKQSIYFRFLMAQISLFEGDLQIASEDLNIVLKFFKKKKMLIEEAETYFVLGTIYRISGVYDTADFMLRASLEIYEYIGLCQCQAEVLGTLGLLMSVQNRFEEAESYYQKALTKANNTKPLKEFILLQQAMLNLLQKANKKALKIAKEVLQTTQDNIVMASACDILSRINLNEKKYSSSVKYAAKAADIFFRHRNYASSFESMYLKAIALSEDLKLNKSEETLRWLIEQDRKHKSCFQIASAQTLLGIVLLKKGENQRAKAVFNQALSKELCNNRNIGVAIDYANLAIVEKAQGNMIEANIKLQKAIELAKDTDNELLNILKNMID